ncbi:MAG: CbtA family protein [Actinomycetota bacterium]|nr:CbtA family protein [Actinomycetota bacterium]
MTVRASLIRGLVVGLLAGAVGFVFARSLGEPQVRNAIHFESFIDDQINHLAPTAELVTRPIQANYGLATGTLVFGVAIGGIFALVFAVANGRIGDLSARATALVIAALGLVSVYAVPNLKYPANPPSVGSPDTLGRRTWLYLLMIVVSIVFMIAAVIVQQQLLDRFGGWNATILVAAAYLAVMAICYVALPGVNEVPQKAIPGVVRAVTNDGVTFPPQVLWRFRVASFGVQALVWLTIGLGFGAWTDHKIKSLGYTSVSGHR